MRASKTYNRVDLSELSKRNISGEAYIKCIRPCTTYLPNGERRLLEQVVILKGFTFTDNYTRYKSGAYENSNSAVKSAIKYIECRKAELLKIFPDISVQTKTNSSEGSSHFISDFETYRNLKAEHKPLTDEYISKLIREHNINLLLTANK